MAPESPAPRRTSLVSLFIVIVLAVVVGWNLRELPKWVATAPEAAVDADLAAVRAYLANKLGPGEWKEIRYWPAVETKYGRVCRLRFRDRDMVPDEVFLIKGGKASWGTNEIHPNESEIKREFFPD